jgi:hypothetical protein
MVKIQPIIKRSIIGIVIDYTFPAQFNALMIAYLLVVLMSCNGNNNKKSATVPLVTEGVVENKASDKLVIKKLNTIGDYWPIFQQAVERKDRETILKLIKVRTNENDSIDIGIPKEEIEGLINVILHEDISEVIKRSTYGLEVVNWDIGVNLVSDKPVYYLNATGHIKDIEEGMPDNFGIQLFFGEVDGEYKLFHDLFAG